MSVDIQIRGGGVISQIGTDLLNIPSKDLIFFLQIFSKELISSYFILFPNFFHQCKHGFEGFISRRYQYSLFAIHMIVYTILHVLCRIVRDFIHSARSQAECLDS